jgi:hypothetical protein
LTRDLAGYAVTTPARTAVDLAADLPLPEALVLLDSAARLLCETFVAAPRRRDYTNPALVEAARELLADAARVRLIARPAPGIALANPARESGVPRPARKPLNRGSGVVRGGRQPRIRGLRGNGVIPPAWQPRIGG